MAIIRWIPRIILLACICLSLTSLKVFFSPPKEVVLAYNQRNLIKIQQVDNLNP